MDQPQHNPLPKTPKTAENAVTAPNRSTITPQDLDNIVERIAAGEYASHISRELGISPQALHKRLKDHGGYRFALLARNNAKIDKAQSIIEEAIPDQPGERVDFARANAGNMLFRASLDRASRECPDEWGQRQHLDIRAVHVIVDRVGVSVSTKAENVVENVVTQADLPDQSVIDQQDSG